jgi:hypothetical protein
MAAALKKARGGKSAWRRGSGISVSRRGIYQ